MTRTSTPLILAACLSALLAACSSTPKTAEAPAPAPVAQTAPAAPAVAPKQAATPAPAPANVAKSLPLYLDPTSDIATKRSIYFDFDRSAIKPEYTALIERHGQYLASNPELAIRVEGNTDERGSPEYNLALGQRRAQSVAKALALVGVKDKQMEVVSWGEERPRASGHTESAWSQNRRVDLQYPAK